MPSDESPAPAPRPRRVTQQRMFRLGDATWEHLRAVAVEQGLFYGGQPSRAGAVAWLVEQDRQRRQAEPENREP